MCFYTSFGTPHRGSGLRDVHLFPITHQESFALSCWKLLYLFFNALQNLGPLGQIFGAAGGFAVLARRCTPRSSIATSPPSLAPRIASRAAASWSARSRWPQ